jgi:hypothetical protein
LAGPAQNCLQGTEHETWRPDDAQPRLFSRLFISPFPVLPSIHDDIALAVIRYNTVLYYTMLCYTVCTVLYCLATNSASSAQLGQESRYGIQHFKIHASRPWHPSVLDSSLGHHSPNNRGNTVYAVHHFSHALSHRRCGKGPINPSIHPAGRLGGRPTNGAAIAVGLLCVATNRHG